MKNLIILCGVSMVLLCCCKKENADVSVVLGQSIYEKDGIIFKQVPRANAAPVGDGFDLVLDHLDEYGSPTESFYIYKIPKKKGKYEVVRTMPTVNDGLIGAKYFTISNEGDVLDDVYVVDETSTGNFIEITSFNEVKNEVAGKFSVKMKIDSNEVKQNPSSPDSFSIEKGEFNVKID